MYSIGYISVTPHVELVIEHLLWLDIKWNLIRATDEAGLQIIHIDDSVCMIKLVSI